MPIKSKNQSGLFNRAIIRYPCLALLLSAVMVKAASAQGVLEEVIVTAQFRQQDVQDTPIAITVISGEMLDVRGHNTLEEISAQAPNVTLTRAGAFAGPALIAFIRGVGQTDFNPALEPGVGLYVDDVYYSTLTGSRSNVIGVVITS